jgi:hypothetical protein
VSVVLKLRRCSGRSYASDLRRGLDSTPKTRKPILQWEIREKLSPDSDLETWRLSQTWKQVSHRHLISCMTILLLLQRFKREMKSNRMPDDGGRGRGGRPPPPPPPPQTNLEEYERKLSSAAHDDVFADASDELSRPWRRPFLHSFFFFFLVASWISHAQAARAFESCCSSSLRFYLWAFFWSCDLWQARGLSIALPYFRAFSVVL